MSARSRLVEEKNLLAPFGAISGHFFHGPEKCKKKNAYFPWWADGCYDPKLVLGRGTVQSVQSIAALFKLVALTYSPFVACVWPKAVAHQGKQARFQHVLHFSDPWKNG